MKIFPAKKKYSNIQYGFKYVNINLDVVNLIDKCSIKYQKMQ